MVESLPFTSLLTPKKIHEIPGIVSPPSLAGEEEAKRAREEAKENDSYTKAEPRAAPESVVKAIKRSEFLDFASTLCSYFTIADEEIDAKTEPLPESALLLTPKSSEDIPGVFLPPSVSKDKEIDSDFEAVGEAKQQDEEVDVPSRNGACAESVVTPEPGPEHATKLVAPRENLAQDQLSTKEAPTTPPRQEKVDTEYVGNGHHVVAVHSPRSGIEEFEMQVYCRRSKTISVAFSKSQATDAVGMRVENTSGMIVIKSIDEMGLLGIANEGASIQLGDMVTKINGISVANKSLDEVADLMNKNSKEKGEDVVVQVEASGAVNESSKLAVFYKAKKDMKLGIGLSVVDGALKLTSCKGLACDSVLEEGDRVISINGKSAAAMSGKEAVDILKSTQGVIQLVVEA